jgi:hypothetical protein
MLINVRTFRYWCPCNHEVKGSIPGKQGIIGKGDWCLRSRWALWCDCSYAGAPGFVLCGFYNFFDVHVEICVWKITTYNLHKPNSDCPAFLYRQDPVFSQIPISYKKCRQCKHVMLVNRNAEWIRRTITYGIGWLLYDWNNLILLRQNQHKMMHKTPL